MYPPSTPSLSIKLRTILANEQLEFTPSILQNQDVAANGL